LSLLRRLFSNREDGRLDLALAGLLFLGSFAVYLQTMRRSFGWGDSSELTTAAYHLGIGHSPGYPTYMLLGYLFSHLPFATVAFRMNLMAAFFGALAVALSYLAFRRITLSRLGAFLGAAAFAFTASFWDLTTEAEVYTLHSAFVAAIILLLLKWSQTRRPHLGWVALLCGLSLGNHALTALLLPGVILFVLLARGIRNLHWKPILITAAAFLLGISIYLYLPIRGPANAPPRINNPHTLQEIITHVTAPCYRDVMFTYPLLRVVGRLYVYGGRLLREVSWAGIVLGLAGLALLWRRNRKILLLLGLLFGLNIFYAVNYGIFDIYSYYITSFWVWCALIGLGGEFAVSCGERLLMKLQGRRKSPSTALTTCLAGALAMLLPFWLLTGHWKMVDVSQDRETERFAHSVFGLAEKNSIILGDWWAVAPLGYLKYIEGLRPDLTLSPAFSLPTQEATQRHLKREFLRTFHAVYATEILTYGINALRKKYLLIPQGPLYRVIVDGPKPEMAISDRKGKPRLLFGDRLALIDWEIQPEKLGQTEVFSVSLFWQSLTPDQANEKYDVITSLAKDAKTWAWREKTPLAHGLFPMASWKEGQTLVERHLIYFDSEPEPGEYQLEVRVRCRSKENRLLPVSTPSGEVLGKGALLGEIPIRPGRQQENVAHNEESTASTRLF